MKIEDSKTPSKLDISQPLLSLEEIAVVMAMRSTPSKGQSSLPSSSNAFEDFQQPLQVSFAKLDAPLPPNSFPPTAATAPSTPSTLKTEKKALQKQTGKWDLHDLAKNQFTLASTLNKPRWEKLDRILKMNSLYTLAVNERVSPTPTETNRNGFTDEIISLIGPPYDHTPADDVPNFIHDIRRLQQVMYAAFDKALYHQSQGFLNEDPVLMYKDLKNYFYGRDNNGINAARAALTRYKINPAISLKADITLFEETLTNVEYAADEIITENIRLSILDEKFCLDTRLGVRERLTHCQCSFYSYAATMDALKNTPNASVTPGNHSRMNNFQQAKSKDLCNNFLKGKCTYGEKCKYVHGEPAKGDKTPTPLKAITDVQPTVPKVKPTKTHARPKYISEAHRIKLGAMTGKVTSSNPLGISHNQEVILKFLQGRDIEWNMRGGRDSNGNEYAMNMLKLCEADGSPDEPPTPEVIVYTSPHEEAALDKEEAALEEAVEIHIAHCREQEEEAHIRKHYNMYGSDDEETIAGYGYSHLQYTKPTPPRPRSAPYIEPQHRKESHIGYTYDYLNTDYESLPRTPGPIKEVITCADNEIIDPQPISAPTHKTKLRMTDDRKDFICNTIIRYHHCLPDNSVVPKSLLGYISYVYDVRPMAASTTAANANEKREVQMSVNIFGWSPVNLLTFTEIDSLYVYLGDPHLLELLNVIGNVFLHASTTPHHADTPLVEGSYNSFSPFAKTFNHVTYAGSYQSSVINIFSYGFYFNCICKLDPYTDIRAYLMLTIIYDFMAFTSKYYRFRLNSKPASVSRLSVYRDELLRCIADYSNHINIDNENALEFEALKEIFRAVIKNASPIPHLPADGNIIQFTTPPASRKRASSPVSFQSPEGHTVTKRPRFSEGHDEASDDDEGEAHLLFSPATHARPQSAIIDLSQPVYPTPLSPSKLNDVTDINFFASIPLNAMHNTETTIIMDSGAGRTGTSDMSLLRNVQPSYTTTVTGAFGPAIKPSHTGTFGPHNLDAVYIKSMGPQTLVSLSQFCNAGNKFIGIFTPTEYRMYDATSAMPALQLLNKKGIVAERGTVQNGIYVRS